MGIQHVRRRLILPRESLSFSIHKSARVCRSKNLYHLEHCLHTVGYINLGARTPHVCTIISGHELELVSGIPVLTQPGLIATAIKLGFSFASL
jgi:hypothetical protein